MKFILIIFFLTISQVLCINHAYFKYYDNDKCEGAYKKIEKITCNVPLYDQEKNIVLCGYKYDFVFIIYSNFTKKQEFNGCKVNGDESIKVEIVIDRYNTNEIILVVIILFVCILSAYSFAFRKKTFTTSTMTKSQLIKEMIEDIASYSHVFRSVRGNIKDNKKEIFV